MNDKYSNEVVNALCQAMPELRVTEQQQQLAPAGQAEADVWQSIRVYETGEPAISAGVIRRMEVQKGGGVSVFFSGMKKAGDWAGCNATHEAFEAYYKWFADERFGGDLEPVHEMVACAGGKRVNAGTNSTADCSQTVAFCLQDHDIDRVCIARRGARRAFYKTPTDLARVLDDSRLPETLRKLLSTATVVSFASWLDVCQAIVCGTVCRGNQWPVQDPRLHTDWCTRFDTRCCSGPTVMPLMRDPQSTLRVRIGTAHSVFNVLGFAFQFCTLVLFGMASFGVSVGNPQSGGDAWRVRINRQGEVAAGHSWLGKRKRDETTVDETTVHGQPLKVQKFAMSASGAVVFEARKKQRTLRISSSDAPDESAQIGDPPPPPHSLPPPSGYICPAYPACTAAYRTAQAAWEHAEVEHNIEPNPRRCLFAGCGEVSKNSPAALVHGKKHAKKGEYALFGCQNCSRVNNHAQCARMCCFVTQCNCGFPAWRGINGPGARASCPATSASRTSHPHRSSPPLSTSSRSQSHPCTGPTLSTKSPCGNASAHLLPLTPSILIAAWQFTSRHTSPRRAALPARGSSRAFPLPASSLFAPLETARRASTPLTRPGPTLRATMASRRTTSCVSGISVARRATPHLTASPRTWRRI